MFSLIDRLLRRHPVLLAALVGLGVLVIAVARLFGGLGGGPQPVRCDEPVGWDAAAEAVGRSAAVVGPAVAVTRADDVGGQPTFINLGAPHPEEPRFDVVVYDDVATQFDEPLADLAGETVCAVGEVRERDGVPQTVIDSPPQLTPLE